MPTKLLPSRVRIDASTICQLKCPSCPTAAGTIDKFIHSGFLKLETLKNIVESSPWIRSIELSNWGEVFLNPELYSILEYTHARQIEVTIGNGANLNNARSDVLEALVKFQIRSISCSIDGSSQKTYQTYRVNGNLDNVLKNIKEINRYKEQYQSPYPELIWQYILFGHNEHEVLQARDLAKDLKMSFSPKLQWDDLYDAPFSPLTNSDVIKEQLNLDVTNRKEFNEKHQEVFFQNVICTQLWNQPQINFDGEMLGCCVNYWSSFGNVLTSSAEQIYLGEKMTYARQMLLGKVPEKEGIACTTCSFYKDAKRYKSWVKLSDVGVKGQFDPLKDVLRKVLPQPLRRILKGLLSVVRNALDRWS